MCKNFKEIGHNIFVLLLFIPVHAIKGGLIISRNIESNMNTAVNL
jgi:hypothetical protein